MNIEVVMATYNGEKFLEEQVRSILDQTLNPTKIRIFDDQSSDHTFDILQRLKEEFPHKLEIEQNSKNLGVIANFMKGIRECEEGNYIALSDQDDIWEKDKLLLCSQQMREVEQAKNEPCLIYSDLSIINESGDAIAPSFWKRTQIGRFEHRLEVLLGMNFVTGCTTLMNPAIRSYLTRIPLSIDMHDYWMALIACCFGGLSGIDQPLVKYRQHASNVLFNTSAKPKSKIQKILDHWKYLMDPKSYLSSRFEAVEAFYGIFGPDLTESQKEKFEYFLSLKGKNYVTKRHSLKKSMAPFMAGSN